MEIQIADMRNLIRMDFRREVQGNKIQAWLGQFQKKEFYFKIILFFLKILVYMRKLKQAGVLFLQRNGTQKTWLSEI